MRKTRTTDLSQRFHDRIIEKFVNWVLGQKVDEGKVSELKWDAEEREIINKLIDNPKAAGINATITDPKFRKFFKSIAQNGLNTADMEMFYKHRESLPLKKVNWAYDIEDFDYEGDDLISTVVVREGFYMLEFQSDPEVFQSGMPVTVTAEYVDGSEPDTFTFRAVSERIVKRLIWLKADAQLVFSSENETVFDEVSHIRLSRATRNFFISRMFKKLGMSFNLAKHAKLTDATLKKYWTAYDQIFSLTRDLNKAYQVQQMTMETRTVPGAKKQMFDLSRWLR